jgi:hypothetical protein
VRCSRWGRVLVGFAAIEVSIKRIPFKLTIEFICIGFICFQTQQRNWPREWPALRGNVNPNGIAPCSLVGLVYKNCHKIFLFLFKKKYNKNVPKSEYDGFDPSSSIESKSSSSRYLVPLDLLLSLHS